MLVRKIYVFSVLLLLSVAGISQEALAKTITLTSQRQLTIEMVNEVANGQAQVALSGDAKRMYRQAMMRLCRLRSTIKPFMA